MALDGLEPVEKFPIKIGGENTHLSIIVSVLSVGIPTTSNVVATTAIAPRIIASIIFVILISPCQRRVIVSYLRNSRSANL